jgi:excisionase family DNA binding protein
MTAPDELLTVAEVAAITKAEPPTLYAWRHHGKGPRSFKLGGRVVYYRSAVEAWLKAREAETGRGGESA